MPPTPLLAPEYVHSLPATNTMFTPPTPLMPPMTPWLSPCPTPPRNLQCPLMPHIPLQVVNCHYFATDHLHAVKMLIFYHCHFQLLSLCNWPSSWVHPVYKIPSLGVKYTSSVSWSSGNFWNISENMHYKDPVASQHWKTNKVVWTWKDDWLPWRTSTYKWPLTWEGNYLVIIAYIQWLYVWSSIISWVTKFSAQLSSSLKQKCLLAIILFSFRLFAFKIVFGMQKGTYLLNSHAVSLHGTWL